MHINFITKIILIIILAEILIYMSNSTKIYYGPFTNIIIYIIKWKENNKNNKKIRVI